MGISGTLRAILLIVWRKISYRYVPSKFYYALWLVLMFRFTVPFNFKSILSVLNLFKKTDNIFYGNSYIVTMEYLDYTDLTNMSPNSTINGLNYAAGLWLLISVFFIGLWFFFSISAKKRLEYAVLYKNDIVQQVKADMCVKKDIKAFVSPNVLSPVVIGFFNPRIILPKIETLSDEDKKYAIAHEIIHIKRYDYILKPLFYFVAALHWYNPLIWYCFWLFNEDTEISCDRQVLNIYGSEHKTRYASVLVDYADRKNHFQFGYLSFAQNKVSARIEKVLDYNHLSLTKSVIFTAITVLIGLCTTTNPVLSRNYQYIPKTVYVNRAVRNDVKQFAQDFTKDIETNNIEGILQKSTADKEYFSTVYSPFENCNMALKVEKIFYTSRSTADVHLKITENDGSIFPMQSEKIIAQMDSSIIMDGFYVERLQNYEKYNNVNMIDHRDEAVVIVEKMIKFGLTDAYNTPLNAPRVVAFCMDIAYDRNFDKSRTAIPQKEIEDIAKEFFLFDDFSNLRNTDYYNKNQKTYTYDKSIGTFYEYCIIAYEKTDREAVITVEFYKDPLQTQVEKIVKYKLKKV